jgi:hypothetical protein
MASGADTFTCIKHVLRWTALRSISNELNELGHVTLFPVFLVRQLIFDSTFIYLQQRLLTACSSFITTRPKQLWQSSIADRDLALRNNSEFTGS